jgi:hypothetical protein
MDWMSIIDQGGFTYIEGGFSAVPEPSSLVLACLASAMGAAVMVKRQRRLGRRLLG